MDGTRTVMESINKNALDIARNHKQGETDVGAINASAASADFGVE